MRVASQAAYRAGCRRDRGLLAMECRDAGNTALVLSVLLEPRWAVPCRRMTRFVGALALWLSGIAIAACDLGPVPFHCEASEQCVDEGAIGTCEANGFCSFPELASA